MSVFTYPVKGLRRVLIPQKCGWTLAWDSRSRWNGRVVIDSNDYPAKNLDCMFVREPVARFMSAFRNKIEFGPQSYPKNANGQFNIWSGIQWVACVCGIPPDLVQGQVTVSLMLDVLEDIIKKNRGRRNTTTPYLTRTGPRRSIMRPPAIFRNCSLTPGTIFPSWTD